MEGGGGQVIALCRSRHGFRGVEQADGAIEQRVGVGRGG